MKKQLTRLTSLFLLICMIVTLAACSESPAVQPDNGSDAQPTPDGSNGNAEQPSCPHSYVETIEKKPLALAAGTKKQTCSLCGNSYTEIIPATKTLKVLAIGNSFSTDATEYLWNVANDGGVETVVVGNLYIGGCTLNNHMTNLNGSKNAYKYYKNTNGTWNMTENTSIQTALLDEEWDIITLQQASGTSGVSSTYSAPLSIILPKLSALEPNADIYWHMTWAYQGDSTHSDFSQYNKNQITMYNAIVNAVKENIATNETFRGIIPSGTAIQNLRSSYLGDTLTRDGYHMSYSHGRYTAALTWFAYLTGGSIESIDWVPTEHATALAEDLAVVKEAVTKALAAPLAVTECNKVDPTPDLDLSTMTDAERIAHLGYNINDYFVLDWAPEIGAFYNSKNSYEVLNSSNSTASNLVNFIASKHLKISDLPIGSLIIIDSGYNYRPEGWFVEGEKTGTARPGAVTDPITEVTAAWWGTHVVKAFNLGSSPAKVMTAEDATHLRIYIPKSTFVTPPEADLSNTDDGTLISSLNKNINDYIMINWHPEVGAFYNCKTSYAVLNSSNSTASNLVNFIASGYLTKDKLPVGALIIVDEGYNYRPEGWTAENVLSDKRAASVTTRIVEVTEEWWGSWTIRGFNLGSSPAKVMTAEDAMHLRIFVPIAK